MNFIDSSFIHGNNFSLGIGVIIEKDVIVGDDVYIGDYSKIMSGARIGNNVEIMDYVKFMPDVIIGNNCKFDDYVNISGYCKIGNNVEVKRCTMLGQGIIIEDDVSIASCVCTTRLKYPKIISEKEEKEEPVIIKTGSMIGSRSLLLAGVIVGEGAIVAAGALITKNCEPFGVYIGNSAKLKGYRNVK